MKETNAIRKLGASTVNVFIVLIVCLPLFELANTLFMKKIIGVLAFFAYNLLVMFTNHNRCVGMMVMKTYYAEEYPLKQHLLYNVFYTLSFSTLLFWVVIPFDLIIFNLLLIQLPMVLMTKTTLHGYLSGGITTVSDHD